MKNIKKWTAFVLATLSVLSLGACAGGGKENSSDTTLKLVERERVENEQVRELLKDLTFARGLYVSPFISNNSQVEEWSMISHGGNKADGDPYWTLAQWGCTHDMRTEQTYTFTREGNVLTYDDGGKYMHIDTDKAGVITLGIKGSEEYTRDENGNVPLPHLKVNKQVVA